MNRKVKIRPSLEQLDLDMGELKTYISIGKKYGVTDNCIKKWIKNEVKAQQGKLPDLNHIQIKAQQSVIIDKSTGYCLDCQIKISSGSIRCKECNRKHLSKPRPSNQQLFDDLQSFGSYAAVARHYQVDNATIKNWLSKY